MMFRQSKRIAGFALFLMVCQGLPGAHTPQQDFEQYIASIRKSGMSESASSALKAVASIQSGGIILSFPKDEASGTYSTGYESTLCPIDPEKAHKFLVEQEEKAQQEIRWLKPYADADGSGFVSTSEGEAFRQLVEFGYKVSFVVKKEGYELNSVARALAATPELLKDQVARYNELMGRMKGYQGKPLPKLPPFTSR